MYVLRFRLSRFVIDSPYFPGIETVHTIANRTRFVLFQQTGINYRPRSTVGPNGKFISDVVASIDNIIQNINATHYVIDIGKLMD